MIDKKDTQLVLTETYASSNNSWEYRLTHIPTGLTISSGIRKGSSRGEAREELYSRLEESVEKFKDALEGI